MYLHEPNAYSRCQESECCAITFKRLAPQIQQSHICSLYVQCVPAVNRTISCNSHPLVSRWLMPKQQTFLENAKRRKSSTQYPRLGWWRAHFQKDWSREEEPTSNAPFNILGSRSYMFKDFKVLYVLWMYLSDQCPKNWLSSGVIEVILREPPVWFCWSLP